MPKRQGEGDANECDDSWVQESGISLQGCKVANFVT